MFEREEVSRFVTSRLSLWCSVCGAREGQGCKPVGFPRFFSHDAYALGMTPRPQAPTEQIALPRDSGNRPRWATSNSKGI